MRDFIDTITYNDLDENDKEIADCIGLENFKNLSRTFGGSAINIKLPKSISVASRNKQIYSEFNGGNYKQLAQKYSLSVCTIYRIIREFYKVKNRNG